MSLGSSGGSPLSSMLMQMGQDNTGGMRSGQGSATIGSAMLPAGPTGSTPGLPMLGQGIGLGGKGGGGGARPQMAPPPLPTARPDYPPPSPTPRPDYPPPSTNLRPPEERVPAGDPGMGNTDPYFAWARHPDSILWS